jgi:hypothetical protein
LWVVVWKHPLVERVCDYVAGWVGIVVGGKLGVEQGEYSSLFGSCHSL